MSTKTKSELDKLLNDKTSGSSEILNNLNVFFLRHNSNLELIKESAIKVRERLSHFTIVKNYLDKIELLLKKDNPARLLKYLNSLEFEENEKMKRIFQKIYNKLPEINAILTISKSGTLIEVFRMWSEKNKKLKIIIPESRPASEGKLMAKALLKYGINIELITDAMSGIYIHKADAAIIGADTVLKNGNVINKTGSLHVALLCKYYKKPFYVLATRSKFQNKSKVAIKQESSEKLWAFNHPKLKVTNIPFEEVQNKLITGIVSE